MFPNLKAEMARAGITNEHIAEVLQLNASTVSAKLNQYDRLKFCECMKIKNAFFPELGIEYLFAIDSNAIEIA